MIIIQHYVLYCFLQLHVVLKCTAVNKILQVTFYRIMILQIKNKRYIYIQIINNIDISYRCLLIIPIPLRFAMYFLL